MIYGVGQSYQASYGQMVYGQQTEPSTPVGAPEQTTTSGKAEQVSSSGACKTCQARKYVDRSAESDVSFQTPGHIAPGASAMVVAGHERQHVANAVQKGQQPNAKLLYASVRLSTAVCPECGRVYVSGGITNTRIQYSSSPYDTNKKSTDSLALAGANIDLKL